MKTQTHCAGCHQSFASYGMKQSEGVVINGLSYCNDDCEMEAELDAVDNADYMEECGLNQDGSEWL